jgi:hypothetical protein
LSRTGALPSNPTDYADILAKSRKPEKHNQQQELSHIPSLNSEYALPDARNFRNADGQKDKISKTYVKVSVPALARRTGIS